MGRCFTEFQNQSGCIPDDRQSSGLVNRKSIFQIVRRARYSGQTAKFNILRTGFAVITDALP